MAARKRKIVLTDAWREKIQAANIIERLSKHVQGKVKMSTTQVAAARILLGKVVPDVAKTELTGPGGGPLQSLTSEVKPDQIEEIAKRLLTRV